MDASLLRPEFRRPVSRLPRVKVITARQRAMTRALLRMMPPARMPQGVSREKVRLHPRGAVRVFTPAGGGNGAALLWIHGGGMVIGRAAQDDARCAAVAKALDIVVVSTEYRLAPEHPYPAPLDDCLDAWRWLLEIAGQRGIDPSRLAVGGQSAGAGLAAGLTMRLHDDAEVQPVAQWLFCPMLDDRTAQDRGLDDTDHFIWNNASNRAGWDAYLQPEPGHGDVPVYAAPARRADLAGLPPAWIGAGEIELFYDENKAFADRLVAADVPCVFESIPGAPHGFEAISADTDVTKAYLASAFTWLGDRLSPRTVGRP